MQFSRSLLKKGREGGKRAASLLTDALTARSETNGGSKDGGWSLVAFAFVDRVRPTSLANLSRGLTADKFVFAAQFELGRFVMAVSRAPESLFSCPCWAVYLIVQEGVLGSWTMLDEFVLGFNGAASGVLSLVDTAREDVPRKLSSAFKVATLVLL
jgi:hypothetical protein